MYETAAARAGCILPKESSATCTAMCTPICTGLYLVHRSSLRRTSDRERTARASTYVALFLSLSFFLSPFVNSSKIQPGKLSIARIRRSQSVCCVYCATIFRMMSERGFCNLLSQFCQVYQASASRSIDSLQRENHDQHRGISCFFVPSPGRVF